MLVILLWLALLALPQVAMVARPPATRVLVNMSVVRCNRCVFRSCLPSDGFRLTSDLTGENVAPAGRLSRAQNAAAEECPRGELPHRHDDDGISVQVDD